MFVNIIVKTLAYGQTATHACLLIPYFISFYSVKHVQSMQRLLHMHLQKHCRGKHMYFISRTEQEVVTSEGQREKVETEDAAYFIHFFALHH